MRTFTIVVTLLAAASCGNKGEDRGGGGGSAAPPKSEAKEESGPPPKDAYKGKNRLVNLLVAKDGKTGAGDVWVRRGFKWGPVKLAENVAFGTASSWFGIPEHMSPVFLPPGAKADDKEISGVAYGKPDEVVTGLLMSDGTNASVVSLYEVSKEMPQAIKPPAAGQGGVILFAYQLRAFEQAMTEKYGGSSFEVGDGAGACRPQRDPKMQGLALGGTSQYELDLPPGKAKISLHKWPGKECKESLFDFEVTVTADKSQWVFLYTPDAGKTIAALAVPFGE